MILNESHEMVMYMSESFVRRQWQYFLRDQERPRKDVEDCEEWIRLGRRGELDVPGTVRIVIHNEVRRAA